MRHRRLRLLLSLPLAGVLAGCGAATKDATSGPLRRPVEATARCSSGVVAVGNERVAVAAVVRNRARVYRKPGGRVLRNFGRLNQNGFPTVFRVLATVRGRNCRARWYRVQVPIKPNGAAGYVRPGQVETGRVRTRILVDVSARKLTFYRAGKRVLRTTVAVGSSATPTPLGRYYVNQLLIPQDTSGPFGPGAIGISAFSEVLTGWTQGGPVAIHGTNQPSSIGRAVSNGCIRLRNAVLKRLFDETPAGTPVVIRR